MAGCEKCWAEAGRRAFSKGTSKVDEYHAVLKDREARPCYLDCPKKHPDHYAFTGCPACGYLWGDNAKLSDET